MRVGHNVYDYLTSLENMFQGWAEFRKGKQNKPDVLAFERHLEDNVFKLHEELETQTYKHGPYHKFRVHDPKPRDISKATVRDRLVHHLVYRSLNSIYDSSFISHSYASRTGKGVHLAVKNLARCLRKVSRNYSQPAYTLKCDIRKFFDTMSHQKLVALIDRRINDSRMMWLIIEIVESFKVEKSPQKEGG